MKSVNLSNVLRKGCPVLKKKLPAILTGVGIAGMFTTMVLVAKETPKATKLLEEKKEKIGKEKLTPSETFKTVWKCYAPAAATIIFSTACIIGANSVHSRRNAAIATACAISESAFRDYKSKVIEAIGERKEQEVHESIVQDKIEKKPISKNEVIMTACGDTLCFDAFSGRYFKSDRDNLEKAVNKLNRQMRYDEYVSLNDFYDEIGLSHTSAGTLLGWSIDGGYAELKFSSHLAEDGTPCLAFDFTFPPRYDYLALG